MPEAAIRLSGVTKRYRLYSGVAERALDVLGLSTPLFGKPVRYAEHAALASVDLEVARGERVGVVGRNGAGKTTLLKLIAGNFAPTAGEVRVSGRAQALMSVGLGFHPEFTGIENIRSALLYNGLPEDAIEPAVAEVADFAELGEYLEQPMRTYSQGMQARLMFAAATAVRPDILIVDEVLGAGDAYFSAKSAHRMRGLTATGCTLLLVSHSMEQVLQFCDRAIWFDAGRVRADGKALDVVRAYEEFIAGMTHQRSDIGNGNAVPAGDFPTPSWQREMMAGLLERYDADSGQGSRWRGEGGISIRRIALKGPDGKETGAFKCGEPIRVQVTIAIERPGSFPVRFAILFMTLGGMAIARVLSPYFELQAGMPAERQFEVTISENRFTAQDVVFSVAAFKQYDPAAPDRSVRYDLLSRSLRMRIWGGVPNDPGATWMTADWHELSD
jgi:lipopolysaccharide transport system ATP-binding protein